MTSANVIEYRIKKDGKEVGHHRENVMCTQHFEELVKFAPLEEHTITSYGYDEEEEYWEGKSKNLKRFLDDIAKHDKKVKEALSKL
ncbi:MAG TPA: hypothetical protein VJ044_19270 [Candidatus Hodarchaeales archaeon]|nr:hypothetical protein [Candidatus Hodarchaeales archaeon]